MRFVFYDLETTGKNTDWSQVIQFAAIYLNENLEELDRIELNCRLKTGVVPEPEALVINNTSIEDLEGFNLSHYELINIINNKIEQWSPAYFFGYNSINFDEEILRKSFFKSLLNVYSTQLEGNKRGDLLNVIRSFININNNTFKTMTNKKGNISFKLENLSKENKINHKAHDAMGDVIATIELAKKVKINNSIFWENILKSCSKQDVKTFIYSNNLFSLNEFSFGKTKTSLVTNICSHPHYDYPQCFDLSIDPKNIIDLNFNELKKKYKEKPKFLKSISHSKHPSIFDKSYFYELNSISQKDKNLFEKRATLIQSDLNFVERVKAILSDEFNERENYKSQEDIFAEESLYQGGFPSYRDKMLMDDFHQSDWKNKYSISKKFDDKRFEYFALKILYEETPELLPKNEFNKIHKIIGKQIMTTNNVKWFTIPKAYKQIDDLRNKYIIEKDGSKLDFVEKINSYLLKMEKTFEPTKYL